MRTIEVCYIEYEENGSLWDSLNVLCLDNIVVDSGCVWVEEEESISERTHGFIRGFGEALNWNIEVYRCHYVYEEHSDFEKAILGVKTGEKLKLPSKNVKIEQIFCDIRDFIR